MTIKYAHCVKFTPNQLDQYPHSRYEWREAQLSMEESLTPEGDREFIVYRNGIILSNEETEELAYSSAAYVLMNASRLEATP